MHCAGCVERDQPVLGELRGVGRLRLGWRSLRQCAPPPSPERSCPAFGQQLADQGAYPLFDLIADRADGVDALPDRVVERPVEVALAGEVSQRALSRRARTATGLHMSRSMPPVPRAFLA